jgi:hypothetical protein
VQIVFLSLKGSGGIADIPLIITFSNHFERSKFQFVNVCHLRLALFNEGWGAYLQDLIPNIC